MQNSFFLKIFFLLFALHVYAQPKKNKTENNPITEAVLVDIVEQNKHFAKDGKVADYIPELGKMNPDIVALSVVGKNGKMINVGAVNHKFTMQSIAKIIALFVAVRENGESEVFKNMGYFGTDKPFNHFGNLEITGKPLNPMMNAGAILTTSMISDTGEKPFNKILNMVRFITKNNTITYNKDVYLSEKETGHRNRGMFYIMKNNGLITGNEDLLDIYFKECSIEVTAEDLAKIGYFFANECVRFDGDATYKNSDLANLIQSQMMTAGMYEFSGEYARRIGLPTKSGVGGGMTVCVPGKMGIGTFSAPLDKNGNSVVGYQMILNLANRYKLNIFNKYD